MPNMNGMTIALIGSAIAAAGVITAPCLLICFNSCS